MKNPALKSIIASTFAVAACYANSYAKPINSHTPNESKKIIAYMLLDNVNSSANLHTIALNPKKYQFTRLVLSFANPRLSYDGKDLKNTGLFHEMTTPPTIQSIKNDISQIEQSGKQVYLSVGGWDYSMGGDGDNAISGKLAHISEAPDSQYFDAKTGSDGGYLYFKTLLLYPEGKSYPIDSNGNCQLHDVGQAPSVENSWCHVAEPGSASAQLSSFPYPYGFPTAELPNSSITPDTQSDNHYAQLVKLAKDLGVNGIDVDDEEFWSADWYRTDYAPSGATARTTSYDRDPANAGPWLMNAAVTKFAAILNAIETDAAKDKLLVSIAAPAVGAIPIQGTWGSGEQWWGGNLKGLVYNLVNYNENKIVGKTLLENLKGGIGIMTYDLAADEPNPPFGADDYSPLDVQVATYTNSYLLELKNIVPASLIYPGAEIGNPAFPAYPSGVKLPLYENNSGLSCGAGQYAAGGCDADKVFSEKTLTLPEPPSTFDKSKIATYWQSQYDFNSTGGVIIWQQFSQHRDSQISTEALESYLSNFK